MASGDEDPLLAEIRAAPDDDGPRLVFADLLSQRGDPWGELIVAGCELAQLTRERTIDPDRRRALEDRCRAIRRQRWQERSLTFDASLDRGFCHWVGVHDDKVMRVEGYEFMLVRALQLWGSSHVGLTTLADWPSVEQLEELALRGAWPTRYGSLWEGSRDHKAGLVALERVAERARLSSLIMKEIDLRPADLTVLARSPLRNSLRRLAIVGSRLPRDAAGLDWPALEALELIDIGLTGGELRRVLPHLTVDALTALDLSNNPISDDGVRAITERPFPKLRTLRLGHISIHTEGVFALARSSLLRCLTSLSIGEDHAQPTLGALCQLADAAEQLIELTIDLRRITSDHAAEIVRRLRAPLCELRLRVGDHGFSMVKALLNNPALRDLRRLDLSGQPLGYAAVVALSRARLDRLEWLDLSNCGLEPESAYVLAHSVTLPRGLALRMQGNARGPASVTEPLLMRFSDVRF